MELRIIHAIQALVPDAEVSIKDNDIKKITWLDSRTKPTNDAIQAKLTELQADYDSKQYQRDRAVAYPSITDVVVALAEKEEGDDTMWKEITAKRAKVKADNPKPK